MTVQLNQDFIATKLVKFKIDNLIQKCAIKLTYDSFDFTINKAIVCMEAGNVKRCSSFFDSVENCLLRTLNNNGIKIHNHDIYERKIVNGIYIFYISTSIETLLQNNYILYGDRFFNNKVFKNFKTSYNSKFFNCITDLNELVETIYIDYKLFDFSFKNNKKSYDIALFFKDHIVNDTDEIY